MTNEYYHVEFSHENREKTVIEGKRLLETQINLHENRRKGDLSLRPNKAGEASNQKSNICMCLLLVGAMNMEKFPV